MSKAERQFEARAAAQGWSLTKKGWPDFWCEVDGQLCFVEVKRMPTDPLTGEQNAFAVAIGSHQIPFYRWDPTTGFVHIAGPRLDGIDLAGREWYGDPGAISQQLGMPRVFRRGVRHLPSESAQIGRMSAYAEIWDKKRAPRARGR